MAKIKYVEPKGYFNKEMVKAFNKAKKSSTDKKKPSKKSK